MFAKSVFASPSEPYDAKFLANPFYQSPISDGLFLFVYLHEALFPDPSFKERKRIRTETEFQRQIKAKHEEVMKEIKEHRAKIEEKKLQKDLCQALRGVASRHSDSLTGQTQSL